MLECPYCQSDLEFKNIAKNSVPNNKTLYYLIYNLTAQQIRTVYAVNVLEPEVQLNIKFARLVSTPDDILTDFQNYVYFLNSGEDKSSLDLTYPSTGNIGANGYNEALALYGGASSPIQQWVMSNADLRAFSWMKYSYIKVTFSNGDVMILGITGYASLVNFPILLVKDKNGKVYGVALTNGVTSQVVNNGNGILIIVPGVNVKFCYGVCSYTPVVTIHE